MGIGDEFTEGLTNVKNLIGENPAASVGIIAGSTAVIGAGVGAVVASKVRKKRSKKSSSKSSRKKRGRIKHTRRGWKQDRKRRSKQKWEVAYQKRKKKKKGSSRRSGKVYYAKKTGQPYILLKSGKAKFIKGKRRKK
jgi:hypothetical protein